MLKRIRGWLAPPVFDDKSLARQAGLLNTILLFLVLVIIANVGSLWLISGTMGPGMQGILVLGVLLFALRGLLFVGHVRLTAYLLCISMWIALTVINYVVDSSVSLEFSNYAVVIIIAGLLLGGTGSLIFAALSSLVVMYVNPVTGEFGLMSLDAWSNQIIIFFVMAFLLHLADVYIRAGFREADQNAHDLERLNQNLADEITERVQAEQALSETEEQYRQLLEGAPISIAVGDVETRRFLYLNPEAVRMFGASNAEELMNLPNHHLVASASEDAVKERFERLRHGDRDLRPVEYQLYRMNGDIIHVQVNSIPIIYQGRKAALTVMVDITQRKRAEDTLRASEERYRQMLEASPMATFVIEIETEEVLYLNPNAVELLKGESAEQLVGMRARDFILDDELDSFEERKRKLSADEPLHRAHYRYRCLNGDIIDVESASIPITYQGRKAVLSVMVDITERRRAEEALRASEERYREMLEASPIAVALRRLPNRELLYANSAALKLLKAESIEQLATISPMTHIDEESQNLAHERWQMALDGKDLPPIHYVYKCFDGSIIDVEVSSTIVEYQGENAILIVMTDITERKRAEDALRASEERYREMLEATPIAVAVRRLPDRHLLYANPAALRLVRAESVEQLTEVRLMDHMPEESRTLSIDRWNKTTAGVPLPPAHYQYQRLDGEIIDAEVASTIIEYQGEKAVLSVMVDITERKRAEDALRASEERYRRMLEATPIAVIMRGMPDRRLLYANSAALKLLRADNMKQMTQVDPMVHISEESRELSVKRWQMALDGNIDLPPTQYHYRRLDGSEVDVEVSSTIVEYQGENAVLSVISDITERKRAEDALRQSEERYRQMLEASPIAVTLRRLPDEHLLYANPAALELLRAESMQQLAEINPRDYVPPEQRLISDQRWQNAIEGKPLPIMHYKHIRFDGEIIDMEVASTIVEYQGENAVLNILSDITERKRAEDALRQSEERYRHLLEVSPVAMLVASTSNRKFLYANQAAALLLGATEPAEVVGLGIYDIVLPEYIGLANERWEGVQSQEIQPAVHYRYRRLDGTIIDVETTAIPITYQERSAALVVVSDITERKRAADALRESEERYRQMLDASPIAIIVGDLVKWEFLYVNPAGVRLLGAEHADDILNNPIERFVAENFQELADERLARIRSGEDLPVAQFRYYRLDGVPIDVEIASIPITYQGRKAALMVVSDITERKRAQQELLQAEALRIEIEQDRRLIELKESFVSIISHEFRTPLAIILSSKELLEKYYDRIPDEKRRAHLRKIGVQVHNMANMLDDILTISKANAGMLEFTPSLIDLEHNCREMIDDFRMRQDAEHRITFESTGDWPLVMVDVKLLRYILVNLVTNAVKYSEETGEVAVKLWREDNEAVLQVRDHGIGIAPEEIENLFQPFYRAPNAQHIPGTGLGLMIVKSSLDAHGGSISCHSVVDEGTTFTVRLPLTRRKTNGVTAKSTGS